jgi:hypothetical protein
VRGRLAHHCCSVFNELVVPLGSCQNAGSDSGGLGWGLRIFLSCNKLSSNADVPGLWSPFGVARLLTFNTTSFTGEFHSRTYLHSMGLSFWTVNSAETVSVSHLLLNPQCQAHRKISDDVWQMNAFHSPLSVDVNS